MKTFRQHKRMPACTVLATTALMIVSPSMPAAYDQRSRREPRQQQQYEGQTYQQEQPMQPSRPLNVSQCRNPEIEQQVAQRLRQQGFGEEGRILILAVGNRVILLGTVPDQNMKQQAARVAQQASGAREIDNRLQVRRQTRQMNDVQLEQNVQQQLPSDLAQDLQVQAQNGRVTIQGTVRSWQDVADAVEAAFAAGAQQVTSRLTVGGDQLGTQREFDEYGQPRPSRYGTGATGTRRPAQRWQQSARSRQLQQRLTSELQNQIQDAEGITVLASDNAVFLFGRVRDDRAKEQATELAENMPGVEYVKNSLMVAGEGWEQQDDATIQNEVRDELRWSPFVDSDDIQVRVSNGVVTLMGSVESFGEMAAAIENAYEGGARAVHNQLRIRDQVAAVEQDEDQWQQRDQQGRMAGRRGRQQEAMASDRMLAQRVAQQLRQQLPDVQNVQVMEPDTIYVMASQGTVILHGSVREQNLKQQAEQIARSIRGVQDVRSDLSVSTEAGFFPHLGYTPGQEDQMQQMGAGIGGDERCIQMLKENVADQNLQSMAQDVNVTCHNGTFALYGYVRSDDEKDRLERLTRQIPGVEEVDNSLIVRPEGWEQKSDSELKQDVESQLWWSPFVDVDKIEVSVQNGVVTLSGTVDDWDAMRAAVKNAFDAGARRVRSKIQYGQESEQQLGMQQQSGTQPSRNRQSKTY